MRDFLLWPNSIQPGKRPLYRFVSPDQSKYYFTADELERDNLLYHDPDSRDTWVDPRNPDNWTYNGIAFWAGDLNGAEPTLVYHFRSNTAGILVYSTSNTGADLPGAGSLTPLGPDFRVYPKDSKAPGTNIVGIRRFWSRDARKGYAYVKEGDPGPTGWEDQGVVWRAYKSP